MSKPSSLRWLYDNFEEVFGVVCISTMLVCLILQVGIRWVTGSGLAWSEELSRYAFVWTVFAAAPMAVKHGAHVRITAQFLILPPKYRLAFRMLADAIWLAANLAIAWWCWQVVKDGLDYPELSPTLGFVRAYVEMIIPVSFLLMSWRIVEDYVVRWKSGTLLDLVRHESEAVEG
jgi:TRAP-type C4-dicarboxylate transport system permease small subunit